MLVDDIVFILQRGVVLLYKHFTVTVTAPVWYSTRVHLSLDYCQLTVVTGRYVLPSYNRLVLVPYLFKPASARKWNMWFSYCSQFLPWLPHVIAALSRRQLRRQVGPVVFYIWLMLYTRLALPVAVCIAKRGRNTRLAWIANPNPNPTKPIPNPDPNPNPNPTNPIV